MRCSWRVPSLSKAVQRSNSHLLVFLFIFRVWEEPWAGMFTSWIREWFGRGWGGWWITLMKTAGFVLFSEVKMSHTWNPSPSLWSWRQCVASLAWEKCWRSSKVSCILDLEELWLLEFGCYCNLLLYQLGYSNKQNPKFSG